MALPANCTVAWSDVVHSYTPGCLIVYVGKVSGRYSGGCSPAVCFIVMV